SSLMAVYNEIGIGRWNRFIQKLTDMKGGPPARQLSSEIQVVHPIFHCVETRALESCYKFGFASATAGNVGVFSAPKIRNPAASNVIAVTEKIVVSKTGLVQLIVDLGRGGRLVQLTSSASGFQIDPSGPSSSSCIPAVNAAAAV